MVAAWSYRLGTHEFIYQCCQQLQIGYHNYIYYVPIIMDYEPTEMLPLQGVLTDSIFQKRLHPRNSKKVFHQINEGVYWYMN